MRPIDVLSCLLWLFASCPSPSMILSLFFDLTFVLSPSVCPLDAFPSAFIASPPGSWVGYHCSSAVRSFLLIRRSILVPVIQCLVNSLFAALLTRNSQCHAPLTFGVPCRCSAHCWPGVYVEPPLFSHESHFRVANLAFEYTVKRIDWLFKNFYYLKYSRSRLHWFSAPNLSLSVSLSFTTPWHHVMRRARNTA